jgi:hypothetical protein
MATSENVCCQLPAADLPFLSAMPDVRKVRKPWPMKWIVAAILVFIPLYTYLTLHFRRPGPAFNPYQDMRDRADVIRLLKAGYQRVAVDASRTVDEAPAPAASSLPAPGGLPEDLRKTLVESPLLPLEVNAVSAPPTAVAGIDYQIHLSYTIPDNKRQLSGAHLYEKPGEIVIVADFERLPTGLLSRTREGSALLDIPPGSLRPGSYRVTLVGERASRSWTLQVR